MNPKSDAINKLRSACEQLAEAEERLRIARYEATLALIVARGVQVTRPQMVEASGWSRSRVDQLLRNVAHSNVVGSISTVQIPASTE